MAANIQFLFANNAQSTLAASISAGATTVTLAAGTGTLFPNPSTGQQFALTFISAVTGIPGEIVYCTARSADTLTIMRGQEGTTAQTWNVNDIAANFITADQAAQFLQNNVSGAFTGNVINLNGATSGTISILPQAVAGTYNFNLPTNPGSVNAPLISGGGGSNPMSWGGLTGTGTTFVLAESPAIDNATLTGETIILQSRAGLFVQNPATTGTWYTAIPYSTLSTSGTWNITVICENVQPGVYVVTSPTNVSPAIFLTQIQAPATGFANARIDGGGNFQVQQNTGGNQTITTTWSKTA